MSSRIPRFSSSSSTFRSKKETSKDESTTELKKTSLFDFYDALEETAKLTVNVNPCENSPHPPDATSETNHSSPTNAPPTNQQTSSPPNTTSPDPLPIPTSRSYLQNRINKARYSAFKYQSRSNITPPSSSSPAPATSTNPATENQSTAHNPLNCPSTAEKSEFPSQNSSTPPSQPSENPQPNTQYNSSTNTTSMNPSLHSTPTQSSKLRNIDFRENVQRQAAEQKSIGRILTVISLSFLVLIIGAFALATYGGYVIWNRLNDQSATIAEVESKFTSRISTLQASIDRLQIELNKAQKQIDELNRQNLELARSHRELRELTTRTKGQVDTLATQIRQEKNLRDQQYRELSRLITRLSPSSTLSQSPSAATALPTRR